MNARLADDELRALMRDIEGNAPALPLRAIKIDRRHFLKLTGLAGGGLTLGFFVGVEPAQAAAAAEFVPNAFLRISS
jgi:hypothetical protein